MAVIGRDQNVLRYQQERVRRTVSYYRFERHLDYLCDYDPVFLSTELLYLYGQRYIDSLARQLHIHLDIPVDKLAEILAEDPNAKYFVPAKEQPLDSYVRTVSGLNNTKAE